MLLPRLILPLCAFASTSTALSDHQQIVLALAEPPSATAAARRPLKGRFLHLTDVHPDPFYRAGTSEDEACHFPSNKRKKHKHKKKHGHKGKKGKGKAGESGGPRAGEEEEDDAAGPLDGLGDDAVATLSDDPRSAGHWGLPISDCDSPLSHVNATFDWIEEHFKGEVDFVVWTGDNARHDIDSRLPRSLPEILSLNEYIVDRVRKAFGKDVPVIASVGNNDVYPHNVMFPGPNKVTSGLLDIWKRIIPEHFLHTFARGGYYSVEAAGGDLLLVSLNTIYFYSRNTVVDGCPPFDDDFFPSLTSASSSSSSRLASPAYLTSPHSPASPEAAALFAAHVVSRDLDPGTEQLLWLEQQLVLARARGMQVLLTGHVPATEANWYEGCFTRYAELVLGYQDTVVGQLYGHMNVDMLSFIRDTDTSSASPASSLSALSPASNDRLIEPFSSSIVDGVRAMYESLPPLAKLKERDYLPVHVNPSVIPTYLPGLRVWEYNTSRGARDETVRLVRAEQDDDLASASTLSSHEGSGLLARLAVALTRGAYKPHTAPGSPADDPDRPPPPPRHSSPHAPARRNTYLSPLAYTQYFLPLESFSAPGVANGTRAPRWAVEYTTLSTSDLARRLVASTSMARAGHADSDSSGGDDEHGKYKHDPVFPLSALPQPVRTLLQSERARSPAALHALRRALRRARLTPYDGVLSAREGLTVRAWVRAARWVLGKEERGPSRGEGEWEAYRERMAVGSGEL